MGKIKTLLLAGLLIFPGGKLVAHSAPDVLASYHFAGTATILTNQNAENFKKVWVLPESGTFRDQVLQKISGATAEFFGNKDGAALVRPLLNDLLSSESLMELRHGTNGNGEFVFAIRLDKERAQAWEKNVSTLVGTWAQSKPKSGSSGWEIKRKGSPGIVRFSQSGDWIVIGAGDKSLPLQENFLQIIKRNGRPAATLTNWLHADLDLPKLQKWFPLTNAPFKLARTHIEVTGKAGDMRTTIHAVYPEKLNWRSEPWKFPSKLIGDPLVSFSASQNVAALVKTPPQFKQLGLNPLTNQLYFWAQSPMPFFSFFAMPVADAAKTVELISTRAPAVFNDTLAQRNGGKLVSTNTGLAWHGLSLMQPEIIKDKSGSFVVGGLIARGMLTNPPPAELLQQVLPRTNLVYYDWELTSVRLGQWSLLSQLLPLFPTGIQRPATPPPFSGTNALKRVADQQWQTAATPLLGNSVTEVTVTGENEVQVQRKATVGFTGIELVYLTHWLASPEFPRIGKASAAMKPAPKK